MDGVQEQLDEIEAQLELEPLSAELHQALGKALRIKGDLDQVRIAFERAIVLDPGDGWSHLFLGNLYYKQSAYRDALAEFDMGQQLLPEIPIALICMADAHRALGEIAKADQCFEGASQIDPHNRHAQERLRQWRSRDVSKDPAPPIIIGAVEVTPALINEAVQGERPATAVLLATLWLKSHPDSVSIALDCAKMLAEMNRFEDAIHVAENVLRTSVEATRWIVLVRIGELYREWGRLPEAESWCRRAINTKPDEVGSYIFLGACQARQGKLKDAEATHRTATSFHGHSLRDEAFHNLGLVLRGQGRLVEAAECFRTAIELTPGYSEAIEGLADVESSDPEEVTCAKIHHAYMNNHAAAMVRLAPRWLSERPDDFFSTLDYGEMLYLMGRYDEALAVYIKALNIFADSHWSIFNQLGHMYQYRGRPAEAAPWYQKAVELEPDEFKSYEFLGNCLVRQGNFAAAETTFQSALQAVDEKSFDEVYYNIGLMLRCRNRFAEAAECFKNAIEREPNDFRLTLALKDVEQAMKLQNSGIGKRPR